MRKTKAQISCGTALTDKLASVVEQPFSVLLVAKSLKTCFFLNKAYSNVSLKENSFNFFLNIKRSRSTYRLIFRGKTHLLCMTLKDKQLVTAVWKEQCEPRSENTGLRGFRPGPTQTGLYSHRR